MPGRQMVELRQETSERHQRSAAFGMEDLQRCACVPGRPRPQIEQLWEARNMVAVRMSQSNVICLVDFAFQERGAAVPRIEEDTVCLVEYPGRDKWCGKND